MLSEMQIHFLTAFHHTMVIAFLMEHTFSLIPHLTYFNFVFLQLSACTLWSMLRTILR